MADQTDFGKSLKIPAPLYKYQKIVPDQGSANITLQTGGGLNHVYTIPSEYYNFSRGFLGFDIQPTVASVAESFINADTIGAIDRVQLRTRGNTVIFDIPYFGNYCKMVWKSRVKYSDYQNGTLFSDLLGDSAGLRRNNSVRSVLTSREDYPAYPGSIQGAGGLHAEASNSYLENQYLVPGLTATAGSPFIRYKIPLWMISHSLYEKDKSLWYNEPLIFTVTYAPTTRIGYGATLAAPGANAAAFVNGTVTLSNPALYLPMERNEVIRQQLRQEVNSAGGMSVLIDSVAPHLTQLQAATSQVVSVRFGLDNGLRLKKVYHSPFNALQNLNTSFDNANVSDLAINTASKIATYQTSLDNINDQEFIVTAVREGYLINKKHFDKGVMLDGQMYNFNFMHIQDYTTSDNRDEINEEIVEGLDLSIDKRWSFVGTGPGTIALNHYTFGICQREMVISAGGIKVDQSLPGAQSRVA